MRTVTSIAVLLLVCANGAHGADAKSTDAKALPPGVLAVEDWSAESDDPADQIRPWPAQWQVEGTEKALQLRVAGESDEEHYGLIDQNSSFRACIKDVAVVDSVQQVDVKWHFSSHTSGNRFELIGRYRPNEAGVEVNSAVYYRVQMLTTKASLTIDRSISDKVTTLGIAKNGDKDLRWELVTWYTLKFEIRQIEPMKTELRAKLWPRGEKEPKAWTLTVVDELPMLQNVRGRIGIAGGTSGNRRWSVDNYTARELKTN